MPLVKEIVRAVEYGQVSRDARRALAASTVEEVHRIGAERLREAGLLEHPDIGRWLRGIVEPILGS